MSWILSQKKKKTFETFWVSLHISRLHFGLSTFVTLLTSYCISSNCYILGLCYTAGSNMSSKNMFCKIREVFLLWSSLYQE